MRGDRALDRIANDTPTLPPERPPGGRPSGGFPVRGGGTGRVYSRDIGRIAEGLDYGIVGINEGIISTEITPSDMSYGLEVRSGLSVSRSTGTETCSWTMNHRPRTF